MEAVTAEVVDGGFDHAAAAAGGVSIRTFYRWRDRGEAAEEKAWEAMPDAEYEDEFVSVMDPDDVPYWRFWQALTTARGRARVGAEKRVYQDSPGMWLKNGPGRTRPGEPGWTDQVEVTGAEGGPIAAATEVVVRWENDWRAPKGEADGDDEEADGG